MKEHEERRHEILDAAQHLFYTQGYADTPVSAILEAVGVAKGTFYHYFKGKEDVLDQLVERSLAQVVPAAQEIADTPGRDPLDKLLGVFGLVSNWKMENRELMLEMVRVFYRDENILLRTKVYRTSRRYMAPVMGRIIAEGVESGVFNTPHPHHAANIVFRISESMGDDMYELILRLGQDPQSADALLEHIEAFETALERIIGAPEGSLHIVNRELLEHFASPHDQGNGAGPGDRAGRTERTSHD